ncbi:MAG: NADPH2:quinone reductase [Patiriisocius sp.]|jgi:NADPH2:quinone reductase
MRAIVCSEFDSPDRLKVSEIDDPVPAADEVLIEIKATGLGYVDALTVAGQYQIKPPLPFTPGNEIAGIITQIGSKVKHLRTGQRVIAMPSQGGLAEMLAINERRCLGIPEVLSYDAAASFLVNYCTAYHGLTYCGNLKRGERVLILGAAGGVGVAAIDVAKALGATVIAAASTEEKRAACLKYGADSVLDYTKQDWREDLKSQLDGQPLDVVYDPVGGDFTESALRSLGPGGRFLVVGFATGQIPKIPLNLALLKRCSIVGVNWGGHIAANPTASKPVTTTLLEWIAARKLKPQAGETYSLDDAGSAMMKMLNREAIGKVVINIGEEL